jgi:hypothetical protein
MELEGRSEAALAGSNHSAESAHFVGNMRFERAESASLRSGNVDSISFERKLWENTEMT